MKRKQKSHRPLGSELLENRLLLSAPDPVAAVTAREHNVDSGPWKKVGRHRWEQYNSDGTLATHVTRIKAGKFRYGDGDFTDRAFAKTPKQAMARARLLHYDLADTFYRPRKPIPRPTTFKPEPTPIDWRTTVDNPRDIHKYADVVVNLHINKMRPLDSYTASKNK